MTMPLSDALSVFSRLCLVYASQVNRPGICFLGFNCEISDGGHQNESFSGWFFGFLKMFLYDDGLLRLDENFLQVPLGLHNQSKSGINRVLGGQKVNFVIFMTPRDDFFFFFFERSRPF